MASRTLRDYPKFNELLNYNNRTYYVGFFAKKVACLTLHHTTVDAEELIAAHLSIA